MSAIPGQQQAYAAAVVDPIPFLLNNNSAVAAALNAFVGNAGQLQGLFATMLAKTYFTNRVVGGGARRQVIRHVLPIQNPPQWPGNANNTTAAAIFTEYLGL